MKPEKAKRYVPGEHLAMIEVVTNSPERTWIKYSDYAAVEAWALGLEKERDAWKRLAVAEGMYRQNSTEQNYYAIWGKERETAEQALRDLGQEAERGKNG